MKAVAANSAETVKCFSNLTSKKSTVLRMVLTASTAMTGMNPNAKFL